MLNHKQNVVLNGTTVSQVALEMAGRNTEKWLIVADAKWKQSRPIGSIRYERRGLSCGTLLLRSWVKGQFSVWRWDGDEGCPSSITDDSQSALTFNTWTYLSTALSLCSLPPTAELRCEMRWSTCCPLQKTQSMFTCTVKYRTSLCTHSHMHMCVWSVDAHL